MIYLRRARSSRTQEAFTLAEVVICLGIVAVVFGGILCAYMQSGYRAEWAGYNLAAQSQAIQSIEEARSAKWDAGTNELAVLFPGNVRITTNILDMPISGTNKVYVTNFSTLTLVSISTNPPVSVYFVRVDTVWQYIRKGQILLFTNTVADYFAQDQ
jgi:type II secretory pathway pseudopilin PulG